MLILVTELPKDQVPFVGVPDEIALEKLHEAIASAVAMNSVEDEEIGARQDPRLVQLAQQFVQGKHAIFITMHAEPSHEIEMPKERGLLRLIKSPNRRDSPK
jgi:hypothetical protein